LISSDISEAEKWFSSSEKNLQPSHLAFEFRDPIAEKMRSKLVSERSELSCSSIFEAPLGEMQNAVLDLFVLLFADMGKSKQPFYK
jgi:hypothetical protein